MLTSRHLLAHGLRGRRRRRVRGGRVRRPLPRQLWGVQHYRRTRWKVLAHQVRQRHIAWRICFAWNTKHSSYKGGSYGGRFAEATRVSTSIGTVSQVIPEGWRGTGSKTSLQASSSRSGCNGDGSSRVSIADALLKECLNEDNDCRVYKKGTVGRLVVMQALTEGEEAEGIKYRGDQTMPLWEIFDSIVTL